MLAKSGGKLIGGGREVASLVRFPPHKCSFGTDSIGGSFSSFLYDVKR